MRIHVVITDGGSAPNVIPERAAARVWVRALDTGELDDALARVRACAEGAALGTGCRLESELLAGCSPPMLPNLPLADCYRRQLHAQGLAETDHAPDENIGSSDITHVSRVVPTIHPNFPIATAGQRLELHTRAFAEATSTESGLAGMLEAARSLALTTQELVRRPDVRQAITAVSIDQSFQ